MPASPPLIHGKSRMRKRACTDLCGGRSAMVVPTATTDPLPVPGRGTYAPGQPLTVSLQSLPHSLRSGQALSGAKGQPLCRFLLFQPLGQQNLEQRLIGNLALVRQDFEQVALGPPSGPPILMAGGSSSGAGCCRGREQDNPNSRKQCRQNHGAVEKPQGWRASLALHFLLRASNAIRLPCFPRPLQ
jgi:hypothetical protein